MTEDQAQEWLKSKFGPDSVARVAPIADAVIAENGRQNLISPASVSEIWSRHIIDSAQLLLLAPESARSWVDVGTGAGFPGMIVAALCAMPIVMVEPRRRRAEFLQNLSRELGFSHAEVRASKIEAVSETFDVISARAVASVDDLFASTSKVSHSSTTWLLPKGRSWSGELELAQRYWQGLFHVEQSVTSEEARIIVAQKVARV